MEALTQSFTLIIVGLGAAAAGVGICAAVLFERSVQRRERQHEPLDLSLGGGR